MCVVLIITEEREVINLRNGHRSKVRVGWGRRRNRNYINIVPIFEIFKKFIKDYPKVYVEHGKISEIPQCYLQNHMLCRCLRIIFYNAYKCISQIHIVSINLPGIHFHK